MAFEWKDSYSVGIDEIDKQHQRLFEIGRKLSRLASDFDSSSKDEVLGIIKELKDYTVYHFRYEELLMQKYNYSGFEDHKAEHDSFVEKLYEDDLKSADQLSESMVLDMIDFIFIWITGHILQTDRKYMGHLGS